MECMVERAEYKSISLVLVDDRTMLETLLKYLRALQDHHLFFSAYPAGWNFERRQKSWTLVSAWSTRQRKAHMLRKLGDESHLTLCAVHDMAQGSLRSQNSYWQAFYSTRARLYPSGSLDSHTN